MKLNFSVLSFLIMIVALQFSLNVFSQTVELDCSTPVASDGTVFKVTTGSARTAFGSPRRAVFINKIKKSSGLQVPGFNYVFSLDRLTLQNYFVQINGKRMVNTGGGINGMTDFDSLNISINQQTKQGGLSVQPTYSSNGWTLNFSCTSIPTK